MTGSALAQRIGSLRERSGLNQVDFGLRVGTTQSTVSKWEAGETPSTENLVRISREFAVSLDDLLSSEGPTGSDLPMSNIVDLHAKDINDDAMSAMADIEERLRVASVPLNRLYRVAGIAPSTWTRWRAGLNCPNLSTWARCVEAAAALCDGAALPSSSKLGVTPAIPALHQPAIEVARSGDSPRTIEIRQGDAVVTVLDCFVEDLIAALQRAGR